jgi:hypothetical protein
VTVADAFQIRYAYLPEEIVCTDGDALPWPEAHDLMAIYWVLHMLFSRDRHAPEGQDFSAAYYSLYTKARAPFINADRNVHYLSPASSLGWIAAGPLSSGGISGSGPCSGCLEPRVKAGG